MENSIFVIGRFSFVKLIVSRRNCLFDWILQLLLDVGEEFLSILFSNGRNHRKLNAIVLWDSCGRQPESPQLTTEEIAEICQ